jgi:hypothetical protein
MIIDLKPILGDPYKVLTNNTLQDDIVINTYQYEVPNIEFIANGVLFIFVLILMGNILLRTIFPKKRR